MFRFREIKEVKDNFETRNKVNEKKEEEGFKKIKPETDMTVDEAKAFINSLFGF